MHSSREELYRALNLYASPSTKCKCRELDPCMWPTKNDGFFTIEILQSALQGPLDIGLAIKNNTLSFRGLSWLIEMCIISQEKIQSFLKTYTTAKNIDELVHWCTREAGVSSKFTRNMRDVFTCYFGWSIPSLAVAKGISQFIGDAKTLEIGGGVGIWTRFLLECDVNVVCTDNFTTHTKCVSWTPVVNMDAKDATKKYKPDCLFVSWGSGALDEALLEFTGDKIVVIGEGECGCTEHLEYAEARSEWQKVPYKSTQIKQWDGIFDKVRLYVRVTDTPV